MFDEFSQTVLEMMREFGSTGVLIRHTTGEYDTATGTVSVTEKSIPVDCILTDLTNIANGVSTKYGTEIQQGDKEIYMRPVSQSGLQIVNIDPATDSIRVGTTTYRVVAWKEHNTTGSHPILYTIYARR